MASLNPNYQPPEHGETLRMQAEAAEMENEVDRQNYKLSNEIQTTVSNNIGYKPTGTPGVSFGKQYNTASDGEYGRSE